MIDMKLNSKLWMLAVAIMDACRSNGNGRLSG